MPVTYVVVLAFAPWDNVGSVDNSVLFRRYYAYSAEGATMVIGLDHNTAESLIPGSRPVVMGFYDFPHNRRV